MINSIPENKYLPEEKKNNTDSIFSNENDSLKSINDKIVSNNNVYEKDVFEKISNLFSNDLISLIFSRENKINGAHREVDEEAINYAKFIIDSICDEKALFFKDKDKITKVKDLIESIISYSEKENQLKKEKNENIDSSTRDFILETLSEKGLSAFLFATCGGTSHYICQIEKNGNNFDLHIYSAANGIKKSEFFDVNKGGITSGCYSYTNITSEALKETLENLKRMGSTQERQLPGKLKKFLTKLEKYAIEPNKKTNAFIKLQHTPCGIVKSINALLLNNLDHEDFKKFSLESKFQAVLFAFEKASKSKYTSLSHLKMVFSSFKKFIYKNRDKEYVPFEALFAVCRTLSSKIDEMEKKKLMSSDKSEKELTSSVHYSPNESGEITENSFSIIRTYEGTSSYNAIKKNINESLKPKKVDSSKSEFTTESTTIINSYLEQIESTNLLQTLENVNFSIEESLRPHPNCGGQYNKKTTQQPLLTSILIVDNLFDSLIPVLTNKDDPLKGLKKEEALKALKSLNKIMSTYGASVKKVLCKHSIKTKISFLGSLALAQKLVLLINDDEDKDLSKYGIYIKPYIDQIEKDPAFIATDKTLFDRFKSLITYFEKVNDEKKQFLCNFWESNNNKKPEFDLFMPAPPECWYSKYMQTIYDVEERCFENRIKLCDSDKFSENSKNPIKYPASTYLLSIAFTTAHPYFNEQYPFFKPKDIIIQPEEKINHLLGIKEYDFNSESKTPLERLNLLRQRHNKKLSCEELTQNSQYSHSIESLRPENQMIHENSSRTFLDNLEIALSVPDVQTLSILQLLENDLTVLKELKNRHATELALFKILKVDDQIQSPFFESLENNPSIHIHIDKMTEKAVKFFFTAHKNDKDLDYPAVEALLFILKMKSLSLKNSKSKGEDETSETGLETLIHILNEIEKKSPTLELKIDIKLTRLMLFQSKPYEEHTEDHLASAVSDHVFVKTMLQEEVQSMVAGSGITHSGHGGYCEYFLSKFSSVPMWHNCLQTHMSYMKALLSSKTSPSLLSKKANKILEKMIGENKNLEWNLNSQGWLEAGSKEEGIWAINLSLGEIITPNGHLEQQEKIYYEKNPDKDSKQIIDELFPDRENVKEVESDLLFEDKRYGAICYSKDGKTHRNINGIWYKYKLLPRYEKILYPPFLFSKYTAWICRVGEKLEGVISDPTTGKTVYTMTDGEFFNLKGEVMVLPYKSEYFDNKLKNEKSYQIAYACIPHSESRSILNFDKNAYFWGEKKESEGKLEGITLNRLEFPNFHTPSHQILKFTHDSLSLRPHWLYDEDRDFFISPKQASFLKGCNECLTLENNKGGIKVLLAQNLSRKPLKTNYDSDEDSKKTPPSCGYYEFDIDSVDDMPDPKKLSLEKQLFLIHFLTHEKKYEEAARYIDALSSAESLTQQEKALILEILNAVNMTGDDSPNAAAIQLAIYAFAFSADPTANYETFGSKNEFSIAEIYLFYISKISSIEHSLVLNSIVELQIAERIQTLSDKQNFWKDRVADRKTDKDLEKILLEKKLKPILTALKEEKYQDAAPFIDNLAKSKIVSKDEKELLLEIINFKNLSPNAIAIKLALYAFAQSAPKEFHEISKEMGKFSIAEFYFLYLDQMNSIETSFLLLPAIELQIAKTIEAKHIKEVGKKRIIKDRIAIIERMNSAPILKESWHQELLLERIKLLKSKEEIVEKTEEISIHLEKIDFSKFNYDEEIIIHENEKKEFAEHLERSELLFSKSSTSDEINKEKIKIKNCIHDSEESIQKTISAHIPKERNNYNFAYHAESPSINKLLQASVRKDYKEAFQKLSLQLDEKSAEKLRIQCIFLMQYRADYRQLDNVEKAITELDILKKSKTAIESEIKQAEDKLSSELESLKRSFDALKDPFCLFFEEISQFRIRKVQYEILKKIQGVCSQEDFEGYLFELIMAGGKTKVIISALCEIISYQDKVPIILSHHSQFTFAKGTIQNLQKTRFNKDVIAIDHSISDLNNLDILNSILKKLKKARAYKIPLIMKNSLLQTLELKLLLDLEHCQNNKELILQAQERNKIIEEILNFVGKNCTTILDECDLTLSIKSEVNVPGGEPKAISFYETDFIRSLFEYLSNDEKKLALNGKSIKELLQLYKNEQKLLSQTDYENHILPHLIEEVLKNQSEFAPFKEYRESFARYILDQVGDKPTEQDIAFRKLLENYYNTGGEEGQQCADLTGLCKLLTKILPTLLVNTCNREFGRSPPYMEEKIKGSLAGKAVPYLAAGTPSNGTEFGDYVRALCYQYMTSLTQGITSEQIEYLYYKLHESASAQVYIQQIPIEETLESEEFQRLTGFSLKDFTLEKDRQAALDYLNQEDSRRLLAEMELSRFHITDYPLLFRSNSVNLTEMIVRKIACSGTAGKLSFYSGFNHATLDESIRKKIKETYLEREKKKLTSIIEINDKNIDAFLKQTLDNHPRLGKVRSIVDNGFFEKHTNIQVARAILTFCRQSDKLKNIKDIVFFYRDPKTNVETFAYLIDPDSEPIPLKDTTPETLLSAGIDLNHFFVFFDQLRATGTDIPLPPDALSLITVDLKKTTYSRFMQSSLRPRKFLESQDNDLVLYSKEKPSENNLKVIDIIAILEENEKKEIQELVYTVYRAKIANTFRNQALKQIFQEKNFKKKLEIYHQFHTFLVEERNSSFFRKMHNSQEELDTCVVLKSYIDQMTENFKKQADGVCPEEITKILETILKEAEKDVKDEILPKKVKSSDSSQLEKDCEVEVETEKELQIEFEKEQQNMVERSISTCDLTKRPYIEKNWEIKKLHFFKDISHEVLSLNDTKNCFNSSDTGANIEKYAKFFPNNLHMTNNFRQTFENEGHAITDKYQKLAEHMLVIKNEKGEQQFILLSKQDAAYFEKVEGALVIDLSGLPQTKQSAVALEEIRKNEKSKKELQNALWFANFFEGRVENLENPKELAIEIFKGISTQEAFSYLLAKTADHPYKKTKLLQSNLFKGCHIDTKNLKSFIFAIHYEKIKQIKNSMVNEKVEVEEKKKENDDDRVVTNDKTEVKKEESEVKVELSTEKDKISSEITAEETTTETDKNIDKNQSPILPRRVYATSFYARRINSWLNRQSDWHLKDQSWLSFILYGGNLLNPAKFIHMASLAVNIATVTIELFVAVGLVFVNLARVLVSPFLLIPQFREGKLSDFVWKDWSTAGHLMNAAAYMAATVTDFVMVLLTISSVMAFNHAVKKQLGII